MAKNDTLYVLAASYDTTDDAVADYEAIKALYQEVRGSHDFDATVIAKDSAGKVRIVKKHEQPTRHGAAVGLGWGLAVGLVAAIFPPVGILAALAVGGVGGAAIGAITAHAAEGLDRGDLTRLGEVLDDGSAGLLVVYETNFADEIKATVKAARKIADTEAKIDADLLAEDVRKAESGAPA